MEYGGEEHLRLQVLGPEYHRRHGLDTTDSLCLLTVQHMAALAEIGTTTSLKAIWGRRNLHGFKAQHGVKWTRRTLVVPGRWARER